MSPQPYNAAKVRFNRDEKIYIANQDDIKFDSIHNEVSDLKGNGKDWIIEAVDKAFEKIHEKNCKIHQEELRRHSKKLKLHDWWLWALSGTVMAIIAILIFLK